MRARMCVKGYIDLYYLRELDKRRYTLGYAAFTLVKGVVSWQSCLQSCITQSTTKGEYVVVAEACKEVIWLGRLVRLGDLVQDIVVAL